jgi:hypothetical protein
MVEWYYNRQAMERAAFARMPNPYELSTPEFRGAMRESLGFDDHDFAKMYQEEFRSLRIHAVVDDGPIRFVNLLNLPAAKRRLVSALTLTPDRLRMYKIPFFFDLGEIRNAGVAPLDIILDSLVFNWYVYYQWLGYDAIKRSHPQAALFGGIGGNESHPAAVG